VSHGPRGATLLQVQSTPRRHFHDVTNQEKQREAERPAEPLTQPDGFRRKKHRG
jgi:hypothetical protein